MVAAAAGAAAAARSPKGRVATAKARKAVSRVVDQAKEAVANAVSDMGGMGEGNAGNGGNGNGGTGSGGGYNSGGGPVL
ncbi:MAG: hypothetical protein ACJ74H_10345 [Thermoanaerobaculia bacterium]